MRQALNTNKQKVKSRWIINWYKYTPGRQNLNAYNPRLAEDKGKWTPFGCGKRLGEVITRFWSENLLRWEIGKIFWVIKGRDPQFEVRAWGLNRKFLRKFGFGLWTGLYKG